MHMSCGFEKVEADFFHVLIDMGAIVAIIALTDYGG